jgi:signal transduction histidine kinase
VLNINDLYFLEKEEAILKIIADRIGRNIERLWDRQKLMKSQEKLRSLAANLNSLRENERVTIAREFHDELGQALTALKINFSVIRAHFKEGVGPEGQEFILNEISDMQDMVDATIKKVRALISSLRPETLDKFGVVEALSWHAEEFSMNTGIACEFKSNVENLIIDKEKEIAIFRIYQESFTNVAKHARANKVSSELLVNDNCLQLIVEDNGIGIGDEDFEKSDSFGILGMKERAIICGGELKMHNTSNGGAVMIMKIPFNDVQNVKETSL